MPGAGVVVDVVVVVALGTVVDVALGAGAGAAAGLVARPADCAPAVGLPDAADEVDVEIDAFALVELRCVAQAERPTASAAARAILAALGPPVIRPLVKVTLWLLAKALNVRPSEVIRRVQLIRQHSNRAWHDRQRTWRS